MSDKHLFNGKPQEIRSMYEKLLSVLSKNGKYEVQPKKTSIHISHNRAFVGVHPKASYLEVNVVLAREKASPAAETVEQVSKNRFHHFYKLQSSKQLNADFARLLKEAYSLTEE